MVALKFSFNSHVVSSNISIMPNYYVIIHFNNALWIGIAVSVNEEQNDCEIKFMHPKLPSKFYFWPTTDDIPYVLYHFAML